MNQIESPDFPAKSQRKLFDFHGGIHPEEHKQRSNQSPIASAPIAPKLYLPLQQHIGRPAKPIVEAGQKVLKGEVIAIAQGSISVSVHAPTSGTIDGIVTHAIAHPSGLTDQCIALTPDGQDRWCQLDPCEHYEQLSATEIQARVRAAGIAGMGGAGFPTEVKIHPPHHDKVATLILNAAECEPYITADDRLLRERADDVVKGMEIMAYVLEPGECLIGVEDNKPEAIEALRNAVAGTRIEVVVIPTKYPSGGEKQLIKILTDKEVPSGKIPADIGVVCQNVGTAAAVYRAVRYGEPLISRITTLTGDRIAQQGNVEVLLGTPIDWLLQQYGYQPDQPERLIMGGPMMGFTLSQVDTPIVKTTNCILAPSADELPLEMHAQACIRCGLCAEACPAELLPQQLYWFARGQEYDKAEHHNLFDCIECGACAYVCPSSIPLVHYYRHAKGEIRQQRLDQQKSDQARERFEARQERLEREQREKEAKRKARAEAAAKAQAAKRQAEKQNAAAGNNDAETDAKKAAIAEALARSQAKKAEQRATPETELTPETARENWNKAQNKLDKMLDALENAKQNTPDQVEKLTRAVEKNQLRVNQAKQAYDQLMAKASASTPAAPEVSMETLKEQMDKAAAKLDKTRASLEDARDNQPELVEKLSRAVDKNELRLQKAKQAYEDAKKAQAESTPKPEIPQQASAQNERPSIETLSEQVEKARAKLEKMQEALDTARQDQTEHVEKLTRAVEKNRQRVKLAEQALEEAKANAVEEGK